MIILAGLVRSWQVVVVVVVVVVVIVVVVVVVVVDLTDVLC